MEVSMSDEKTDGVLLKGAGGANYFIPQTELAQFVVSGNPDPDGTVAANAPRLDAFTVRRTPADEGDEASTAFILAAEDDSVQILAAEDDSAQIFAAEADTDDE
jgi:hypothetical protein